MTDLAAQIVVLADEPIPGRVRSGLTPPFSPREAAALAGAALADTLAAGRRTRVVRRVVCLAGEPGPWLPDGFEVLIQRGRGLDERIAAALWDTYAGLPLPMVLGGPGPPRACGGRRPSRWPGPWPTRRSVRPPVADSGCSACAAPAPTSRWGCRWG